MPQPSRLSSRLDAVQGDGYSETMSDTASPHERGPQPAQRGDEGPSFTAAATLQPAPPPGATVLEAGWLIIATLIPLWVNLWADQPFELSKALLLRSLVWLMASLWLALWIIGKDNPRDTLRRSPLWAPICLMAITVILATVFAPDPHLSLHGTSERGQGALTLLSYPLLFLIVASHLRESEQVYRLLVAMVATAAIIVPLSWAEALGWDAIGLVSDARSPITATLGRANFVGAYLAILVPLTLGLTLTTTHRWHRRALLLLLAGELSVIVATLARGAWLATGVGLAALGLWKIWPSLDRPARRRFIAVALLLCLIGLALGVVYVLQAQAGSIAARRTIWSAVVRLIGARPLLGYGPDALSIVFPRVYPPQLVYYQGRDVFVDRAHNLFLDGAVTLGIPGVLAHLWWISAMFALGSRRLALARGTLSEVCIGTGMPRGKAEIVLMACLAAIIGHLADLMVSFDVTATATATWLLMALIAATAWEQRRSRSRMATIPSPRKSLPLWRPVVAGALILGAVVATIELNVRPLLASMAHRRAIRFAEIGETAEALRASEYAVELWPWTTHHHRLLAQIARYEASITPGDPRPWAYAEAALLAARDRRPGDYVVWALLGDLYAQIGTQFDPAAFSSAHQAYAQATALAPYHARLYVAWGQVFLDEAQPAAALERFHRAVDLDATDGLAFRLIGDVELAMGRPQAAMDAYHQSAHWSPEAALSHLGLARTYATLGDLDAAEAALAQALALDPHHPDVLAFRRQLEARP